MHSTQTLKRHAGLVDAMAEAQGLDLEEQMLRGKLSFSELEDAVLACTGCAEPCQCEKWLNELDGKAAETPIYCRNASLFSDLKARS
ncbi:DUF6455 family protein [Thalassococcus lentus]|uniref:DUF6455 family protein n=1 Tax=Thalassococcus lentus TaxID=1210524 RepID=A0ABT4XPI3_9RHOB|nr:DUF6455 family protein [Thalassococcus lentus]MDA7423812.1 DUF6455 family protein [Thalassococcus lentus]